jgi:hypothetical protein
MKKQIYTFIAIIVGFFLFFELFAQISILMMDYHWISFLIFLALFGTVFYYLGKPIYNFGKWVVFMYIKKKGNKSKPSR